MVWKHNRLLPNHDCVFTESPMERLHSIQTISDSPDACYNTVLTLIVSWTTLRLHQDIINRMQQKKERNHHRRASVGKFISVVLHGS